MHLGAGGYAVTLTIRRVVSTIQFKILIMKPENKIVVSSKKIKVKIKG